MSAGAGSRSAAGAASPGSDAGSSDSSESRSGSEWDQYSIKGPDSSAHLAPGPPASQLGGSGLRLRQDSLFGLSQRRPLAPTK